jgi:hypothetical protein
MQRAAPPRPQRVIDLNAKTGAQGYGVAAEHMDVVLAALWQHFRRRQRWEAAAAVFRRLLPVYSPAGLLLAAAERAQGVGYGAGGVTLSELLARPAAGAAPRAVLLPATMVGLGHELLARGEAQAAASLARRALAALPRCRPAWLLLARCFAAEKQYAAALLALNAVPTPPLPLPEAELLHVVPPPPARALTQPQVSAARVALGRSGACSWLAGCARTVPAGGVTLHVTPACPPPRCGCMTATCRRPAAAHKRRPPWTAAGCWPTCLPASSSTGSRRARRSRQTCAPTA